MRAIWLIPLLLVGCKSRAPEPQFLAIHPLPIRVEIYTDPPTTNEVMIWKSPDMMHWVGWFGHLPLTNDATDEKAFYMITDR